MSEYVDKLEKQMDKALDTIETLRAENARLIEEKRLLSDGLTKQRIIITGLREALKLFAVLNDRADPRILSDTGMFAIPLRDLRAARAAMGESDE